MDLLGFWGVLVGPIRPLGAPIGALLAPIDFSVLFDFGSVFDESWARDRYQRLRPGI